MSRTQILHLRYIPTLTECWVEEACARWEGTPYMHGRCVIGRGVDCIHFAAAVLDELYGSAHAKLLQSLPADACVHNRRGVELATRAMLRAYPNISRVTDGTVEAGDLVILSPVVHGQPAAAGHLLVAGGQGRLWHANPPRVSCTGYGISDTQALLCVYRSHDKEKWHARLRS